MIDVQIFYLFHLLGLLILIATCPKWDDWLQRLDTWDTKRNQEKMLQKAIKAYKKEQYAHPV